MHAVTIALDVVPTFVQWLARPLAKGVAQVRVAMAVVTVAQTTVH